MSTAPQNFLGSESAAYSINETTGCRVTCRNCGEAAPFEGFDECLPCSVALMLHDDPGYLEFAKDAFAHQPEWLAKLEAEWQRQASAGQMEAA